jgi:hypothetical protein
MYSSYTSFLGRVFFYTGCVGVSVTMGIFLIKVIWARFVKRRKINPNHKQKSISKNTLNSQEELDNSTINVEQIAIGDRYRPKSFMKQVRNFSMASILIIISLISYGTLNTNIIYDNIVFYKDLQKALQDLGGIFALLCVIFGSLLMINWITGLFKKGRKYNTVLNTMWKGSILYVIVMTLLIMYIPMTTSVFSSIKCSRTSCEYGSRFVVQDVTLDFDSVGKQFLLEKHYRRPVCEVCNFTNTCAISNQLCPGESDLRLEADPSLSCTKEMYIYYLPGSVLIFISCTIGVPFVFYRLITLCQKYIEQMYYSHINKDQLKERIEKSYGHLSF